MSDHFAERRIAGEWYDGTNSAMFAFAFHYEFSPGKLVRETRKAIKECHLGDPERLKLEALLAVASQMEKLIKTKQAFNRACEQCKEAGVDPYEVNQIFIQHFGR